MSRRAAVSVTPVATPSSTTITAGPVEPACRTVAPIGVDPATQLGGLANDDRLERARCRCRALRAPPGRRPACRPRRSRRFRTRDCAARRACEQREISSGTRSARAISAPTGTPPRGSADDNRLLRGQRLQALGQLATGVVAIGKRGLDRVPRGHHLDSPGAARPVIGVFPGNLFGFSPMPRAAKQV